MSEAASLARIARKLGRELDRLEWTTPSHVYNPLDYAWDGYGEYLRRFGDGAGRVLLVGMNPGPWGMAQTGVPFGSVGMVRDWFRMEPALAHQLPMQHEKYPILGMYCHRDEGSGKRLWGWARERFGTPEGFFERFFVWNYCPLLFIGKGRNMIPSQLRAAETAALGALCDHALERAIHVLHPAAVVGIGRFAEQRLQRVVGERMAVTYLPHPSPASPAANRDWPAMADAALAPWLPVRERAGKA
ncbi:MAG: hypothetical protein J0H15_06885 [Xanthomonadales bacterium]|nr:hypothetical protein [Xanthomonadales bacterium]